jgi:hypothetical protein
MALNIYYSSEFKKSYETNYNFNIPLDVNVDVRGNEKIKLKLINFSMMNSMLNVSEAHKNNTFRIIYQSLEIDFTINDGSYTATSLKDYINNMFVEEELPITINYDKTTNKFYFILAESNLEFYPLNTKKLLGFTNDVYSFINNNTYYGETFANMLPYTKIIITTNLVFETSSQNIFESKYSSNTGMGDIIAWVNRDIPLFSTINYTNVEEIDIPLANRNIKSINISIMNEFKEFILDAPECHLQLQLITYDNTNWTKRLKKLLNL